MAHPPGTPFSDEPLYCGLSGSAAWIGETWAGSVRLGGLETVTVARPYPKEFRDDYEALDAAVTVAEHQLPKGTTSPSAHPATR